MPTTPVIGLLLTLAVCSCSTPRVEDRGSISHDRERSEPGPIRLANLLAHSTSTEADLRRLKSEAEALAEIAGEDAERADARPFPKRELASRSIQEVKEYFADDPGLLTKRDLRGLKQLQRLCDLALHTSSPAEERQRAVAELREVMAAMQNNRRPTVPESIGVLLPWKLFIRNYDRTIGHGRFQASNLVSAHDVIRPNGRQQGTPGLGSSTSDVPSSGATPKVDATAAFGSAIDLSLLDPRESTFWRRPGSIADQDLRAGFGRSEVPNLSEGLCDYDGPKTSAGTKPGFEVEFDGVEYQIKFMEVSSEPFTARIFHALGYYVDPTDYVPALKVRYDRRLFREFNLRAPLKMALRPFGVPLGSVDFQPAYSPFDYIVTAVFKDGRRISGEELGKELFHHPDQRHPESDPLNFRTDVEEALDYLITAPANVQAKDHPAETIGMWDFEGLRHEDLRELRGAGLLAAWLGWFDARFDNTRLRVLETDGVVQFQHFFTDLGAGMGGGTGWFRRHGEDPEHFEFEFTRCDGGKFEVIHYETVLPCPAFQEMTPEDARWMARLIAQLTPVQLCEALLASGYDPEITEVYVSKLISRRDKMILDLGLENEIPLLKGKRDASTANRPKEPATQGEPQPQKEST